MVPSYSALALLLLYICTVWLSPVQAVWTEFDLVRPNNGSWGSSWGTSWTRVSATEGNGPTEIRNSSRFGWSMTNIGDLNGDGVDDLCVGAPGEESTYTSGATVDVQLRTGAIYILFMNGRGTCDSSTRISGLIGGGPKLYKDEEFGYSVSHIGDLDGDGVSDIVVGAPGQLISSTYILFMNTDGTARSSKLIRGTYKGTVPVQITNGSVPFGSYLPNGPELRFLCRFGQAVLGIGDWDGDGVRDIAVSSNTADGGNGLVYFLYMARNGTVQSSSSFGTSLDGASVGGAPTFTDRTFVGFGSSLLLMPDMDADGVLELAVGANNLDDGDTTHYNSGVVFVCFMNQAGLIKKFSRISELAEQYNRGPMPEHKKNTFYPGGPIPNLNGDRCGTSLATIGDINLDEQRQQRPELRSVKASDPAKYPNKQSIDDLIVGCPQTDTGTLPGRMFLIFLSYTGNMLGFTLVPGEKDKMRGITPALGPTDHFGHSLAGIQDLDKNGLREIAVGAPGHFGATGGADNGAIYVLFLRRRRWHPFWTDSDGYWMAIIIPPSVILFGCISSIIYFFWKFRRKPDEIELLVLKSGVVIEKKKKKRDKKEKKKEEAKVFVDDADDF